MVECYIKTGSIHEGKDLGCGLSHFLEHMLFQGCKGYPGTAAADTLQQAGCSVNAYTSFSQTVYHSSGPSQKVTLMLEVLASMIRYPELPEQRFNAERDVILREYDRCQDDPGRRLQEEFFKLLFLKNPMRIPVIGKRSMIAGVTAEMAADYHRRRYTPGRCFWVVTGDTDSDMIFEKLGELLGDWEDSFLSESFISEPEPEQYAERTSEFVFPDTMSRFTLGIKTGDDLQRKMPQMDILFGLLGMGGGSRLTRKFELNDQLAAGLRSFCYSLNGFAVAGVTAITTPQKQKKLELKLKQELEKVANGDLSNAEINREKNQQYAEYLRQLEELEPVSSVIGAGVLEYGTPEMGDFYRKQLEATTPDEVRSVAGELLDCSKFCITRQLISTTVKSGTQRKKQIAVPETLSPVKNVPLVLIRDTGIPLVHFSMVLPGGCIFEPAGKAGVAKLTAALLGAGTGKHNENQLLTALDKYGADFSVTCGNNSIGIELDAPRKSFSGALSTVTEILSDPLFGRLEFERERERLTDMLSSRKTAALETAFDQTRSLLFGVHPYASGLNGTTETITGLSEHDIRDFYRKTTNSSCASAGFSGDLTPSDAVKWGNALLSALPWLEEKPELPEKPEFPIESIHKEIPLDREQTAVVAAVPGDSFAVRDRYLVYHMLSLAENGLASRLFKEVREKRALAYSVGMDMMGGLHPGWFAFYAQTTPQQAQAAAEQLHAEIRRLAENGLEHEEFERARERAIYSLLRKNASLSGRLSSTLLELFYDRNVLPDKRDEIAWLKALQLKEANAVIQKAFSTGINVTVKAGNLQKTT